MKRTLFFIGTLGLLSGSLAAVDLRLGAVASPGIGSLEAILEGPIDWFDEDLRPEAGLEVGWNGAGYQLLIPLGFMGESRWERGWSWGASVHALAGSVLVPSETRWLWGGEAELRAEWSWSPGIGLALGAGARYVASAWAFPVHAAVEFTLGSDDTLEPVEKKDR